MSKNKEQSKKNTEIATRIGKLADLVWRGNRSQMGRDLGFAQQVVSRVIAGDHQPSAEFVTALANWPGINRDYLLNGVGEPLLTPGIESNVGLYLPVADELLFGPPSEYPDRLSGMSHPVAGAFHTTTAYYHRVLGGSPLTKERKDILVGDLLLVEAAEVWTRRAGAILGRLCIFRVKADKRTELMIGEVGKITKHYSEFGEGQGNDFEQFDVTLYGRTGDASLIVPPWWQSGPPPETSARKTWRISDVAPKVGGLRLDRADVIGVVVKLERLFKP